MCWKPGLIKALADKRRDSAMIRKNIRPLGDDCGPGLEGGGVEGEGVQD